MPLLTAPASSAAAATAAARLSAALAVPASSSSFPSSASSKGCGDFLLPSAALLGDVDRRLLRRSLLQTLYSQAMQDALSASSASTAAVHRPTSGAFGPDSLLSSPASSATSATSTSSSASVSSSISSLSNSTSSLPLPSLLISPLASPRLSPATSTASVSLPPQPHFSVDLFASAVPDHLICAICTGVVHSPLNLSCSHLFCASCLAQWCQSHSAQQAEQTATVAATDAIAPATLTAGAAAVSGTVVTVAASSTLQLPSSVAVTSPISPVSPASHPISVSSPSSPPAAAFHLCPTCRAPFSLFLASPNHAIQHQIAHLTVRCPNHSAGCPTLLQMGSKERNIADHLRSCPHEKVRCRLAGCGALTERREAERHERVECKQRLRECGDCGECVKRGEWEAHRSGLLGCVGLMYCPHHCTTVANGVQAEHERSAETDRRKKQRVQDQIQHDMRTDTVATTNQAATSITPSSMSLPMTLSSASSSSSTTPSFSSAPSPVPQAGSSSKRKFESGFQLSVSVAPTDSQPSSDASSVPSPAQSPSSVSSEPSPQLTVIRRSGLAAHLSVCLLRPIQCDLCFASVLRCQLSQHYADNLVSHMLALQRTVRTERSRSDVLSDELVQVRKENSLLRKEMAELSRHVHSGPLFAYFFDIAPISLLCSHYISNDFLCGDHVYYFALHRQQHLFSAYLYLKSGSTPVALSFVLMLKQRKAAVAATVAQHSPTSDMHRVEGAVDVDVDVDEVEASGLANTAAAADAAGEPQSDLPSALSPGTPFSASSTAFSASSVGFTSPVCLRVKLDVEYSGAEGKGVSNWFTLADLQERGGYSSEEDALTIGVLIKDHSSSWVYSAADALNPIHIAAATDEAAVMDAVAIDAAG